MLAWLAVAGGCAPAWADGLYEARSIVTGMDGRSRPQGLQRALGQVLAKVSGNPALESDPRLPDMDPAPLLQGFAYLDRMTDIPKHDEQGSRDRPYDLIVRFRPDAVDEVLRGWGDAPWPVPRPVLAADITIVPRQGDTLVLRADTDSDERHRGALLAAADRFGVEVVIPAQSPPVLAPPPGSVRLAGVLRWSDEAAGWVAAWRLDAAGGVREWGVRGVGFDAAYRAGVAGAVAVLSAGGGRPAREVGRCVGASGC